jgi:hypothetical protein
MKAKPKFIAVVFLAMLLLAGSSSAGQAKEKAVFADGDFIFTSWPQAADQKFDFDLIDKMRAIGFTHVSIEFRPATSQSAEGVIGTLRDRGYKIALEISAGHYNSSGGLPELVDIDGEGNYLNTYNGKQFLKAPCLCNGCDVTDPNIINNWSYYVDTRCDNWNNPTLAIDPSYTGALWDNTKTNTRNVVAKAQPDIVLFDPEYWHNPTHALIESSFIADTDCSCRVVYYGIGYKNYYDNWKQRYAELKNEAENAVIQANQPIEVYFFGDIKAGDRNWRQDFDGRYVYLDSNYLSVEAGDYPNPNYYVLPNLELLEKNTANDLSGAVPWVSFVYMTGHSNYFDSDYYQNNRDEQGCSDLRGDIRFDTSVSREAGRMLRKAGARGFMVYPNKETYNWGGTCPNNSYGDYWLDHSREMIEGFKEGGDYIEKNKIKNPGFESWKVKSDSTEYDGTTLIEEDGRISARLKNERFIPVFWSWIDSNPAYNDSGVYADLTTDEQSGMYSWRHTRTGDIGTRAINSRTFPITSSEAGNYSFSIQTKASIDNSNGKIEFYLVNTNTSEKQDLGYTGFARDWTEFKKDIGITAGDYNIKIILNDQTGQTVDVFLDTVSFEKAEACGNGECEAALGETTGTCPADCPPECVDTFTLMNQYIPQWKRGEITMLTLMQKMKLWDAGTGCPPE